MSQDDGASSLRHSRCCYTVAGVDASCMAIAGAVNAQVQGTLGIHHAQLYCFKSVATGGGSYVRLQSMDTVHRRASHYFR